MPSARTHDAVTLLLAAPTVVAAYIFTADLAVAAAAVCSFLFGGLIFGPDLDTTSKHYSRWVFLKFLWIPYRAFFRHRSRWSHGLVFGALLRVVYFLGSVTLAAFAGLATFSWLSGGEMPQLLDMSRGWASIGTLAKSHLGIDTMLAVFVGMWLGAASHTVTDITVTYIKTGRTGEVL